MSKPPTYKKIRTRTESYPASTRWMIETDYALKLTEEERLYLAAVNESWAGANPPKDASKEDKKKSYRNSYAGRNDALSASRARNESEPYLEDEPSLSFGGINATEDALIAALDCKKDQELEAKRLEAKAQALEKKERVKARLKRLNTPKK